MVRVLVTVEPRMYREAIALAVQRNRPEAEVMLVPEEALDGQVEDFAPHVLVRNDADRVVPEGLLGSVVCCMEVLYTDGMAARFTQRRRRGILGSSALALCIAPVLYSRWSYVECRGFIPRYT
jgi:hypothetical protein